MICRLEYGRLVKQAGGQFGAPGAAVPPVVPTTPPVTPQVPKPGTPPAPPAQPQAPVPPPAAGQVPLTNQPQAPRAPSVAQLRARVTSQMLQGAASGSPEAVQQLNTTLQDFPPELKNEVLRNLSSAAVDAKVDQSWLGKIPGVSSAAKGLGKWWQGNQTPQQMSQQLVDKASQTGQQFGTDLAAQATKEFGNKETGGWLNYLKSNPSLMLLPIGLMVALSSRGNMGRIAGILAAAGGAANLWGRYNGMKDPKFLAAIRDRVAGQKAGQWTPEAEKTFTTQYGTQWRDLQALNAAGVVNLPEMGRNAGVGAVQNIVSDPSALPQNTQLGAPS